LPGAQEKPYLVLDGSDNFETRYLVSDACYLAAKPLITAALGMSTDCSPPFAPMSATLMAS
jgi:hypothetical protein